MTAVRGIVGAGGVHPGGGGAIVGEIVLVRHGQTEWSRTGRHTGTTDVPLTALGEEQARRVGAYLRRRRAPVLTLSSPRSRARRTAGLAGWADPLIEPDLVEWDYGGYEGRTTAEISAEVGHPWTIWADGAIPGETPGETIAAVGKRADAVLERLRPVLTGGQPGSPPAGDALLFAHGHLLRVLAARWLRLEPAGGALLALSAGSVSVLGTEHGAPVITLWNGEP
jgi:broad specificity phosphatase PhoE